MAKRRSTKLDKTLYRELKIEQQNPTKNRGRTQRQADSASQVASVMLLLNDTNIM